MAILGPSAAAVLTANDRKLIADLFDQKLDEKLHNELAPIRADLAILKREVGSLRRDMRELKAYVLGPVTQALEQLLKAHLQLK